MNRFLLTPTALLLLGLACATAHADSEVRDSTGRRILLKDDGTWRYVDAQDAPTAAAPAASAASAPAGPLAELQLVKRTDSPVGCAFEFVLTNRLPYEIRSLVPEFAAMRANGVAYTEHRVGFTAIKPGDTRRRALRFDGIACADIAKLQVQGGDRCEMGDLDRFSADKGACLARVRVLPFEGLKFEK